MMQGTFHWCLAALLVWATSVQADEPAAVPRPIPLTRPEMKVLLEDVKERRPRIPLPELSDEDRARLGSRANNYEARLRYHYLAGDGNQRGGGFGSLGRNSDPKMSLDYRFKTQLFWIVSRTNNCQYCLGHQESKLLGAGMIEDEIAALDSEWLVFGPAEQAAFRFARKFTLEPHRLGDADIEQLRSHYNDLQILEMILSMAGNNSINRWKEGTGVPQSRDGGGFDRRARPPDLTKQPTSNVAPAGSKANVRPRIHTYLTPTSEHFLKRVSTVAPLRADSATGKTSPNSVWRRPPLESREEVERSLQAARKRTPRLPLADEDAARKALGDEWKDGAAPQWARLLMNFPQEGRARIAAFIAAEQQGELSPRLKAEVSWIVARQDRAWYALGHARKRLLDLGWSDDSIHELDGTAPANISPSDKALFTVARKLAATPIVLTDKDVADAVQLAGPRDVTQLISYTTTLAAFNRITEAAGLTLEQ